MKTKQSGVFVGISGGVINNNADKIRMFIYVGVCLFLTACGSDSSDAPKSTPAAFGIATTSCTEELLCSQSQMTGSDSRLE
ncbi:MAG: hypothetical protein K0R14_746 [Burkholderiales bacterium]|jgi:hypothetical protein|nr:hypothetical protein [Burkholderiales bacterium]